MALADELASFNTKLGGEVGLEQDWRQEGRLQGEARRGQGLHDSKGGTTKTRVAAQDAASSIQHQVSGMPAAAQAALLQTLTAALSQLVAADKGGPSVRRCAINKTENTCALSIGPSRHTMEAF
jgi:hypothetical protein